ncbi:hypothetical protein [Bradyrhizobium sp.]|uniref:hypothetical protein n=1 Tax=Bradyrhizobium sp. TaxID=376 RepID=UPI0034458918
MISAQRLPVSLTPLDVALAALLRGLEPSAVVELPVGEALGCISADLPPLKAHPPYDVATADGWALRANDLVGASSFSPLPLTSAIWLEAGDRMPNGCDCVVEPDSSTKRAPSSRRWSRRYPGRACAGLAKISQRGPLSDLACAFAPSISWSRGRPGWRQSGCVDRGCAL